MSLYDRIADRPLTVSKWSLEQFRQDTSSGFERVSTVFLAQGNGETGRGEDVTYDTEDHERLVASEIDLPTGKFTLSEFSATLDDVALFPEPPERKASKHYRRWAVESAALDLALRQAGETLASALGREYDPVRFVVSTRLPGDPPTTARVREWLDVDPDLEFKLDPTPDWTADLVENLAALDCVRTLDLKGQYEGTDVDNPADPNLYQLVVEGFPDAIIEDPALTPETQAVLEGYEDRISWDYPITGVASVRDLPFEPEVLNVKPSRFGTLESLFDFLEYCETRGIDLYGGGQFELSVGREHLHALASIFYPDAPNDVAPAGYNEPEPREGLPASPLDPPAGPRGLRWPQ